MTQRLVINRQYLRTDWSGGAGTYAEQILDRLDADQTWLDSAGLDIRVVQRPEDLIGHHHAPPPPASQPRGGLAPFAAKWLIPHGFHRPAGHVWRSVRRRPGPVVPPTAAAPPPPPPRSDPVRNRSGLPWAIDDLCIVHELTSYDAHPALGDVCTRANVRLCATFHDIQDFFHPDFFEAEVLTQRRRNYLFYKQYAALLFANSDYTKKTMVDVLGIEPERIVVTPLAGDHLHVLAPDPEIEAQAQAMGRYMVFPAKPWQHKNHDRLLQAMRAAAEVARPQGLRLLLTGGVAPLERAQLQDRIDEAEVSDLVEIMGYQSPAMLQALLRNAETMIFPSLFEGFGMPVLEAMQLGCPVACSNTTSLPEVAGDAAITFDPEDVATIARTIVDVAERRIDRDGLRERGLRNIRRFTWERTYHTTLEGYERLLNRPLRRGRSAG